MVQYQASNNAFSERRRYRAASAEGWRMLSLYQRSYILELSSMLSFQKI
jgi:hypothetical protein